EFESDMLGVRYNALAGYNPGAMADFLGQLGASSRLDAQIRGVDPGVVDQTNYLATHPRTTDRVRAAEQAAGAFEGGASNQEAYLNAVDGMVFGDQPEQGVIRGREFRHPDLRMAFTVPNGFTIVNGQKAVQAFDRNGGVIVYDLDRFQGRNAADYVRTGWAPNASLQGLERINVNGLDAGAASTTGRGPNGPVNVQLVAIRDGERVHRFAFASPRNRTAALSEPFRRTTYSFRKLSAREAAAIKPLRIDIVTVRSGDTAAGFARRMPFDSFQLERWELLNGRSRNAPLRAGEKVKIVVA
ncbi:MAG: M48 family metalloprotease, partial [Pseudomonadota bacterium]